jgi:hypothetical protein
LKDGKLAGTEDINFRSINDRWPAFGYAVDLGVVYAPTPPTLFTIGVCQNDSLQFLGKDGLTVLPSLWKSYFQDETDAVSLTVIY